MNSILSESTFISEVERFTSNPIQKKEDILFIIEQVNLNGKETEFERLTFTAKYICGLLRVIKKAPAIVEVENIDQVRTDLSESIKKGIEEIKELITNSASEKKIFFEQNYFILSQKNFENLSQLFSDLESVKKFLNHLKRQN